MKKDLVSTIRDKFPNLTEENAGLIIDKLCQIKKPKEEPPLTHFITINSINNTGSSIKPGNILLNMRKLLIDSSEIGLTIAGVIAIPHLIPLAALIVWNKVYSNIKIDLDEKHAMAIKLMWENRDVERNWIEEKKSFKLYNQYLKSKNRNEIIFDDFKLVLRDLEKMKCIKRTGENIWWLREWVRKSI